MNSNICVLLDDISQPDLIQSPLIHIETFGCILLDTYVTLVTVRLNAVQKYIFNVE